MSKKKLILLTLLSMISTTGYASNLYLGGQVGLSIIETRSNSYSHHNHLGGYGFQGGGFVGYKFDFCKKYDIGVEGFIFGNTTDNKSQYNFDDTRLKYNASYNYGVRVLPGFQLFEQVEVHMIAGYTRGNFRVKHDSIFDHVSRNFNVNGYQVGGGITLNMTCHFDLRFDGVLNGYTSNRHHALTSFGPNYYTAKIYDFNASVSAIYNF